MKVSKYAYTSMSYTKHISRASHSFYQFWLNLAPQCALHECMKEKEKEKEREREGEGERERERDLNV